MSPRAPEISVVVPVHNESGNVVALLDEIEVGDYVLVHVGYALHKVSPEEAARTLALMAEAGILAEELEEIAGDAA